MRASILIAPVMALAVLLSPCTALAYATDVHFNLTYVLSRLAGFTVLDSRWIAAADESLDHQASTTAFSDIWDAVLQQRSAQPYYMENGKNFHAFTDDGSVATIETRKHAMLELVTYQRIGDQSNRDAMIAYDIALGQYIHFAQDFYAHRYPDAYDTKAGRWHPFGSKFGHIGFGIRPDAAAWRPELARQMIVDVYGDLRNAAGKMSLRPKNIPIAGLHLIMNALVAQYRPEYRYPPHGAPRIKTGGYEFPYQERLKTGLEAALAQLGDARAVGPVPIYSEAQFTLPYDHPETSLSDVKRMMGE